MQRACLWFALALALGAGWSSGSRADGALPAVDLPSGGPGPAKAFPWMRVGLRISYHVTDAMFQGNLTTFRQNDNGTWTGTEKTQPSGSGEGIQQMNFVALDASRSCEAVDNYLLHPLARPGPAALYMASSGSVTDVTTGQLGAMWMRRDQLDSFMVATPPGVTVARIPWKVGGRQCTAQVIRNDDPNAYSLCAYDLATGLLLHKGSRLRGSGSVERPLLNDKQVNVDAGSVSLHTEDFLDARDVSLPWAGAAPPDWVAHAKALHFRGGMTVHSPPGLPQPPPTPMTVDFDLRERGDGWVVAHQRQRTQGVVGDVQTAFVWSSATLGGGWVAPDALARLRQGQLIDDDALTRVRTTVARADDRSVIVSQSNGQTELSAQYDRQSGMLTAIHSSNATLHSETLLQLSGHE